MASARLPGFWDQSYVVHANICGPSACLICVRPLLHHDLTTSSRNTYVILKVLYSALPLDNPAGEEISEGGGRAQARVEDVSLA